MSFTTSFYCSIVIFFVTILLTIINHNRGRKKWCSSSLRIMFAGTFVTIVVFYLPFYLAGAKRYDAILQAVHNAIRVFTADADTVAFTTESFGEPSLFTNLLMSYSMTLYLLAPVLTVGFVLSFFKNVEAYLRFLVHFRKNIVICSALSRESVALADSVHRKYPKTMILFAGKSDKEKDDYEELMSIAEGFHSIVFDKEITEFKLHSHSKKSKIQFFFIDEKEDVNIRQALQTIHDYKKRSNTEIYLFATGYESELLLDAVDHEKITKIRRVDRNRELVYRQLYENSIFSHADKPINSTEKLISILIIGMGRFGTEMVKALSWCGQMEGYKLKINVIDKDPDIESKMAALCPELVLFNGNHIKGEAHYEIFFYGGIELHTQAFSETVQKLTDTTEAFICLGSDELNIETAIKLRILMTRAKFRLEHKMYNDNPLIHALVYNDEKCEILGDLKRFGKEEYNYHIDYIGQLTKCYHINVIEQIEMEEKAKAQHLNWAKTDEEKRNELTKYERYEYFRRSSMASAIHKKLKEECCDITLDLPETEHRRWNAYMRSEGYVFSGYKDLTEKDSKSRNDMALLHPDLIPYTELTDADKEKDIRMLTQKGNI